MWVLPRDKVSTKVRAKVRVVCTYVGMHVDTVARGHIWHVDTFGMWTQWHVNTVVCGRNIPSPIP